MLIDVKIFVLCCSKSSEPQHLHVIKEEMDILYTSLFEYNDLITVAFTENVFYKVLVLSYSVILCANTKIQFHIR